MRGGFFKHIPLMHRTAMPFTSATPSPPIDPLLGLRRIIGNSEHPGLLEISRSSFYELIQAGVIPRPIKVGTRSLWRQSDIQRAIERLSSGGQATP